MNPPPIERRTDVDVLRVFACYLLLPFHAGMVFNPAPFYHVRNGEVSFAFFVLCGFIGLWHMPLLFLLAGWSAAASLRARGAARFLRERASKLVVPLVAGCACLAPGIKYLELRSGLDMNHRGLHVNEELQASFRSAIDLELPRTDPFRESLAEFLPSFFSELDRFSWSHLWFLAYLTTLTVALLPIFVSMLGRAPRPRNPSRVWAYLPIAPLVLIQLTLRERFPGPYNLYCDWANLSFFATFLISGFALAWNRRLEARVTGEWRRALAIALATTCALLASVLGLIDWPPLLLHGPAVAGWCFVVAMLGFARERRARPTRLLDDFAESAFPVYLLHQPVVVLLGFAIVRLPLGVASKFALLLAGSLALTLLLYHYGVRPFRPVRFLCGMKSRGPLGRSPRRGAAPSSPTRPFPAASSGRSGGPG